MAAEFWAGYISGAVGIIIGNPLDIIKVKLQNEANSLPSTQTTADAPLRLWIKGSAAPILTYGALNAILYTTYNRCLNVLDLNTIAKTNYSQTNLLNFWAAGALGGLATWFVSAPTELVKCQAQLQTGKSSWIVAREIWQTQGIRGLYHGGAVTSIRDAVGYGFYFWSYEVAKRSLTYSVDEDGASMKILVAGGIAGVVTWVSIYPLDMIKTRIQSPRVFQVANEQTILIGRSMDTGPWSVAVTAYRQEGLRVFFRGLGVCSIRAFIVNAVQWFVYERIMLFATQKRLGVSSE